jgi:hypothetical protein
MAKVIAPLMSSEARGRLGGLVYNTWRGMSYAKAACAPSQPKSKKQLNIRAFGVRLARAWQGLTAAQRLGWQNYASLHLETDGMGTPKRMTGLNWFIRCNSRLLQQGLAISLTAPTVAAPASPLSFTSADGAGQSVLTFTSQPAGSQIWIQDDGPHSPGRKSLLTKAMFATTAPMTSGSYTLTGLGAGQHDLFARVVLASNGLASPWVTDDALIT